MNRREFFSGAAAALGATALPLPAASGVAVKVRLDAVPFVLGSRLLEYRTLSIQRTMIKMELNSAWPFPTQVSGGDPVQLYQRSGEMKRRMNEIDSEVFKHTGMSAKQHVEDAEPSYSPVQTAS